jgi:hypothetical protein
MGSLHVQKNKKTLQLKIMVVVLRLISRKKVSKILFYL